ncbi:hypothetical protein GCM10012279_09210 [Micromonospora yangpuensis]|nr:hypothetical protein GCM10012279_09210 [Micromonospora yangpuensis]
MTECREDLQGPPLGTQPDRFVRDVKVVVHPPPLPVKVGQRTSLGDRLLYVNNEFTLSQMEIIEASSHVVE